MLLALVGLVAAIISAVSRHFAEPALSYTIPELVVLQLGSHSVWETLRRVLESTDPAYAMDFKKATEDQNNMITVAVSLDPSI